MKRLACPEQFRVMGFAQLTCRESLRDIKACLSAQAAKLYRMGFRHEIKRSPMPTRRGIGVSMPNLPRA